MSNINKIKVSGQTYNIEDVNASKTVELTQAQYDALAVKDPNTFYIITDAQGADLSQYYTSAQTESAITQAVSGKQDTLVSGTNIKTINNESILGEGNITIEGGSSVNVVQTTGTSTTDVMSQNAVTNAFNQYTVRKDSDNGIVRFWSWKSPNYPYGQNSISNFAINGKCPLSKENGVNSSIWQFSLVETSAITTSVTSSSTDAQVPSAKAVYDAIQGGGGGSSYTAGDGIDITNDVISVTGKVDTTTYETYTAATATAIGDKLATSDFNTYSGTVDTAINSKASQSDLSTLSGTVTAHTANTDIHVTTAQTAAWNAKSDFSGSYNDLTDKPTIPTVPTSNTAFTNDAGYITSDAISGKADTSAVTESINAAVSGKADTSDVFITSSNRNSIVSNIHEEVYQLSTDDIYSISATKASSGDIIYCQIMVDNVLYSMQGSSSSITYSDEALSGLVTADFSTSMSITLNDRENHHINEIFFEAYNLNDNSYIKEITIVHNPPIGANKIDYVAGIYTEFVHDKYAMKADLNNKQNTLVSGTNIKTINGESLLGSGNITIEGGGTIDQSVISGSTNAVSGGAVYTQLGGLKLQKITQSAYDNLATKDSNTLYVING